MSQYRVNSSEHFNLYSMYEHLKCAELWWTGQPLKGYEKFKMNVT